MISTDYRIIAGQLEEEAIAQAHGQHRHPNAGESRYIANVEHIVGLDGSLISIE